MSTATEKPQAVPELPRQLPMQFRYTELGAVTPHVRTRAAGDGAGEPTTEVEPDAYDIVITTDTPIDQGWGIETLGHEPGECDLTFAKRGISFLLEHGNPSLGFDKPRGYRDPEYHLGLIEDLTLSGGKLRGVARFAADDALSPTALRVKRDWASGKPTRPFISGGYVPIARVVEEPKKPGDRLKVRWVKWQINEGSNVSMPADPRAAKERAAEAQLFDITDVEQPTQQVRQEAPTMPTTTTTPATPATPTVAVGDDRLKARNAEIAQIVSICRTHAERYQSPDHATTFIEQGLSVDQVKIKLHDELAQRSAQTQIRTPNSEALDGLSRQDRARYSYRAAAQLAMRYRGMGLGDSVKGLEADVHRHLLKMRSTQAGMQGGVLAPWDLRSEAEIIEEWERRTEQRSMGANTPGKGSEWVGQQMMPLVTVLEAKTVLARVGANFNTALSGNLSYPRETGQPTVVFQGENPATGVSLTDASTGEILSGPKQMIGAVKMSRQWLFQTSGAGEARVRNGLVNGTARALDRNGLTGNGANSTPLGIYYVGGVLTVAMGSVTPTWTKITDMIGKVGDQNAELDRMGFISSVLLAARLMAQPMISGAAAGFVWQGTAFEGRIGGYRAIGTTQASKTLGAGGDEHFFGYGDWSYTDVNLWGATEIVVDELTAGDFAQVILRSYGMGDVVHTHPEAVCIGTAAKPA